MVDVMIMIYRLGRVLVILIGLPSDGGIRLFPADSACFKTGLAFFTEFRFFKPKLQGRLQGPGGAAFGGLVVHNTHPAGVKGAGKLPAVGGDFSAKSAHFELPRL